MSRCSYGLLCALAVLPSACGDDAAAEDVLAGDDGERAFCESVAACDPTMLLLAEDECARQVAEEIRDLSAECRSCALTLSCAGIASVASRQVTFQTLCPECELPRQAKRSRLVEQGCGECMQKQPLAQVLSAAEGRVTLHDLCDTCPPPIVNGLASFLIPGIVAPGSAAPVVVVPQPQVAAADNGEGPTGDDAE